MPTNLEAANNAPGGATFVICHGVAPALFGSFHSTNDTAEGQRNAD